MTMDVIRLIEDLEDILEVSNTIPLTGKVMVDKEEVMHILDQLKNQIPKDVSNAQNIVAKENEILEDANMQAKQIVQAAHMEAQKLVDEDELVILAQEKAKEMMDRAEEESTQIRKSSREYVDGLLEETQVQLSDLIKTINANRQELRNE